MERKLCILLVEDEKAHATLVRRIFEAEGPAIELSIVYTLQEANQFFLYTRPDLVIADLFLPDGKGIDLLPSGRAEADYPVIVMTSHGDERVAVEAIKAGALDYVVKSDTTLADLPRTARRAIREWGHIVEHRRAEREIRRRNQELTLLNRIIAASISNLPEEILETACREVAPAFEAPRVAAVLLDAERTNAMVVAEHVVEGWQSTLNTSMPVSGHPVFGYLLANKAPLVLDEGLHEVALAPIQEMMRRRGIGAMLILPLTTAGSIIGTLEIEARAPRRFSNDEINLAWSVADQVAIALTRARLDKERRQLSAAIEQTAESVMITDAGGNITYVNPAFERITGYNRAEVLGQNSRFLKADGGNPQLYDEMLATLQNGDAWHGRYSGLRKDKARYTQEETVTPVRDENGMIVNFVAVQHDVTRELQLEQQYLQAQKMEAVGRLTAGIAHDFNNLLTVINGFAALLQLEIPSDSTLREGVDRILHAGQRAASLTRQLLAFSRKQFLEPRVVDLNTVVTEMDKMLRRIIGEDIELAIHPVIDLWPVKVDPTQIDQVILNLVVNARDAMPHGGQITIETANVHLEQTYVQEHAEVSPGDYVLLAVSDSGIGMDDEIKQHLFEPFFTTKERGKGTGLGLATVFGIIKQSGGHIWVYSEPNRGSTFKIYLPRLVESGAARRQRQPSKELPRGGETILLVEDEPGVRDLSMRVLRRQGYNVLQANNGEEALQKVREYQGRLDLLLTDVIMPRMSGKILADKLRAISPQTKILFVSGYTDSVMTQQGILDSTVMFLAKPFSPTDLARKVREVLDTGQPASGSNK